MECVTYPQKRFALNVISTRFQLEVIMILELKDILLTSIYKINLYGTYDCSLKA